MSYCRFLEGDVYAYECVGGVQFYVAGGRKELDRLCNTFNEAYQYAKELRDTHGLDVPSHAIEALKADALEEAARICGPDGAVAELKAENARLRSELESIGTVAYLYGRGDLKAENAKLRELVRDMYACIEALCSMVENSPGCSICPTNQDEEKPCAAADVYCRMRKLGVEVDA